ncbi:hypothetical protein DdX_18626 [Ditylenchus destructor]|uniref:Uncharacterized protein n=1 Tax=Ditylenchus destructor TaxID=166010 RepID=A0AAD4MJB9_9BILA|nr:hypothetical protein DdX_18626 [Ditylenchus destructor]
MCARRVIRLYSNIETKLLTSLIDKFRTLPVIDCEIPTVVIDSFPKSDKEKLKLGPDLMGQEMDSQGAKFLYVFENARNRMRISFCEKFDDCWTFSSSKHNCYVKFYAVHSIQS